MNTPNTPQRESDFDASKRPEARGQSKKRKKIYEAETAFRNECAKVE
jgi:hypothetical protein